MQARIGETLSKSERLCSERRIDALFERGRRGCVEPLRFCWVAVAGDNRTTGMPVSVLFSVPKRAFRKAWMRNLIKRRMRESYRRRKHGLVAALEASGRHIDVAFVCAPGEIPDFKTIDDAIAKILEQIAARN